MKIFDIKKTYDYGHNIYFSFLETKGWCLIQTCFSYNDYGRNFPYLNITISSNGIVSFIFEIFRLGISFDFISRSWNDFLSD